MLYDIMSNITRHKILHNIEYHIRYFIHIDFSSSLILVEANLVKVLTDLFKKLYPPLCCLVSLFLKRMWLVLVFRMLTFNIHFKLSLNKLSP